MNIMTSCAAAAAAALLLAGSAIAGDIAYDAPVNIKLTFYRSVPASERKPSCRVHTGARRLALARTANGIEDGGPCNRNVRWPPSYRAFMSQAVIHRFDPSSHTVTERGNAAVVEHDWRMAWESLGKSFDEKGRDVLVLARQDGAWHVVWQIADGS